MVVAWLATLVAVLIFLVAVRNAGAAKKISIQFHRTAGAHSSCPLPLGSRVVVSLKSRQLDELDIVGCEANLPVQSQTGRATVSLSNSDQYRLFDPAHEYELAADKWDVYIQGPLQITLFNYSGECPNLSRTFDTFEALIRSKANSLRGMFSPDDKRFDYLSKLNVVRTGDEYILNNEEAHKYWQQTGSLQLLTGLCKSFQSGDVMQSMIFFGELKGKLPSESFVADLQVNPSEFGKTRDLHTASILYALAQEARNRQLGQDVVIDYLSEARTIAGEITLSSGTQLREAIDKSLDEANAPKPMEQSK